MFNRLKKSVTDLIMSYFKYTIGYSAAALAYYIMMTLFPLLICSNFILTSLHLSDQSIFSALNLIIPVGASKIIASFTEYIGEYQGKPLFIAGLIVMMTSSSSAFRCMIRKMEDIQGSARFGSFIRIPFSFVLVVGLLMLLYAAGLVIFGGEWMAETLSNKMGTLAVMNVWRWVRVLLLYLLLFFFIYSVYKISAPKDKPPIKRVPGAFLGSFAIVAVSVIFSYLMSLSTRTLVVYGSLASIIIMLLWFFVISTIMLMGNVYNIIRDEFIKSKPQISDGSEQKGIK